MRRTPLLVVTMGLLSACETTDAAGPKLRDLHTLPNASALAFDNATDGRLDVGPVPQEVPPGAVVPRDEAELASMLADPAGPPTLWLGERTWHGDLRIRRPVALHGAGPGTILEGSGTSTVVDAEGQGIVLDNLTIRGTGGKHTAEDSAVKIRGQGNTLRRLFLDHVLFGASLASCKQCVAEQLHVIGEAEHADGDAELRGDGIKLWESDGSRVSHCLVEQVRDVVVWYSRDVTLEANVVRQSRYGSHFMYTHDCVVRDSAVIDNVVGIFVMYSSRLAVQGNVLAGAGGPAGVGIGFKDSDDITVTDNWFVGNTTGTYLDTTPRTPATPVHFDGNVVALNDIGLRFHAAPHGVFVTANDFQENGQAASVDGGGDATSAELTDNFWSDYAGYDLDADGTGDVAYEVKRLSSELTEAHPSLKLFQGTAALVTLDAVARAVPVLATRLLLRDPRPSVRPHRLADREALP